MVTALEFEEEGRTFRCVVEPTIGSKRQAWWWFEVSGDTHRYAPFHAEPSDSKASVRTRIVAYYTNHLARRLAPPVPRGHMHKRPAAAVATVATAATAETPRTT